jgi:hypothetical protein
MTRVRLVSVTQNAEQRSFLCGKTGLLLPLLDLAPKNAIAGFRIDRATVRYPESREIFYQSHLYEGDTWISLSWQEYLLEWFRWKGILKGNNHE